MFIEMARARKGTSREVICTVIKLLCTLTAVYSFTELAKLLLKPDGYIFLLSERFTQDPLEDFFGKQRARGGRSDNPTAKRFLENTQAIRVSRSLALGGSSSVKRSLNFDIDKLSEKLPKRPRLSKH